MDGKSKKPNSAQAISVRRFFTRFSSSDACLEHIMDVRYGLRRTCERCGAVNATFHKLASRPAYSCAACGAHVHPCAGTIFQDTRTPLQVWFYAIFLFITLPQGVSENDLRRTLGVTYRTARRLKTQIGTLIDAADSLETRPRSKGVSRTAIIEAVLSSIGSRLKSL